MSAGRHVLVAVVCVALLLDALAGRIAPPTSRGFAIQPNHGVSSHMSGDHVAPAGAVGAETTLVGLLAGVGALVRGQVIAAAEYLETLGALVGLEARVEARVARQHVGAREGAAAVFAQVTLGGLRGFLAASWCCSLLQSVRGRYQPVVCLL